MKRLQSFGARLLLLLVVLLPHLDTTAAPVCKPLFSRTAFVRGLPNCLRLARQQERFAQVIRAEGDAGDTQRWAPRNWQLVEVVTQLGGRVTKADVLEQGISGAGLERELLQLARVSGAGLEVNPQGELLYDFPVDLASVLRSKSMRVRLQRTWNSVRPWLSRGGRILFGASLLTTVAVLYMAILVLMTASASKRDDGSGTAITITQNNFAMWFGQDLFFWLFQPSGSYYGHYSLYGYGVPPPKMSFLEAVFSFVFGDGDPNTHLLNESRWQLMGRCIADNGGVVAAEQLAPFLHPPPDLDATPESTQDRRALDTAMLPVLLRFRGKPEVTQDGDILYVFPELQESRAIGEFVLEGLSTVELKRRLKEMGCPTLAEDRQSVLDEYQAALERAPRRRHALSAEFVEEQELKFSEAEPDQIVSCIAYGAFALLATLWFGLNLLSGKAQLLARVHPVVNLVVKAYPLFFGYTTAFLAIPALRFLRCRQVNKQIRTRNEWREQQASRLKPPIVEGLKKRLLGAAKRAVERRSFSKVIYNSSASSEDRDRLSAEDDLRSFDRRLQGEV